MGAEQGCNLGLDRLRQQRSRAVAQNLGQRIGKSAWLGELENVSVGHGVSLLRWRSGGSNTPTIRRLIPSCRHQLPRIAHPVQAGLVTNFNRPGGNLTGIAVLSLAVAAKRLEMLHEFAPGATLIACLMNPASP